MAADIGPDELIKKTFTITMLATAVFVGVVFAFIL